jgi:predicted RND superfamily exporter protein
MGLVVDYSIHTLGAIQNIPAGVTEEETFSFIISYSGKPIFISFLTSFTAFAVMFLSSFKGARTLGLLLTSSLLLSFFLSFYLLPVIILPRHGAKKESV